MTDDLKDCTLEELAVRYCDASMNDDNALLAIRCELERREERTCKMEELLAQLKVPIPT